MRHPNAAVVFILAVPVATVVPEFPSRKIKNTGVLFGDESTFLDQ
jgi:hypothetical protein